MKNLFQATAPIKQLKVPGNYPAVPALWPNRAVRRAVQRGRPDLAPGPWRAVLAGNRDLVKAIQGMH